jgi:hypothetical protein
MNTKENPMKRTSIVMACIAATGLAVILGSLAVAEPAKDAKDLKNAAAALANIKLPPGWTAEDMQACMIAGTPGKMHEHLAKSVGEWTGKCTMWMSPDAEEGVKSDQTVSVSPLMDGRFYKADISGDMPGQGPFHGLGIYGYDNVTKQFVATWLDNHSTGLMRGTGQLSDDGKTLTWEYEHSCPITKKMAKIREIETITGPNTKTFEMYGQEPKSGKEFKMMRIELTRK